VKRHWKLALFVLCISLLAGVFSLVAKPQTAAADNPSSLSFQGKVVNSDGTNVANGTYTFVFKLYTVSSGGSAIWTETQTGVTVNAGIFYVDLGSVCPFFTANACNGNTPVNFANNPNLHLGITFNGDAAGEMSPRVKLQSVPFAFNADRVGGFTASQLAQLSPASQQSGFLNVSGNITSAATVQGATVTATGALQGNSLSINGGVLSIANSGNVTGGTYNSQTISATASFTGTVTVATSISSPVVTSSGALSVAAGGTAQNLSLNASTSGLVSIAGTSTGNIELGGGTASGTGCTVTNSTGSFACNGIISGSGGLSTGSTSTAGSIVLNDGTVNARSITLSSPALSNSYSLSLPSSGPATSQCLQTDSSNASQLVFGNCSSIGPKLTQTFGAYASNQAASATTAMNYLLPTSTTAFSVALSGTVEFKAAAAGSFRACTLMNSAAVTSGSVSLRFRKNGANVSSNNYCTLSTTNSRSNSEQVASGVETFNAGDTIGVALVSTGLAPTTSEHWATFTIEYGAGSVQPTTLQDAYANGSSITTANNSDIIFNLADTAVDSDFFVNIASGSSGRFAVQNNNVDVFSVDSSGNATSAATISASVLNASSELRIGGVSINAAGTLNNVAYLNQANNLSSNLTVSASGGKSTLSLSSTASDTGLTIGGDATLYRSASAALKTDGSFTAGGVINAQSGLTIDAGQNLTVDGEAFDHLTGDGLRLASGSLSVKLITATDGLSTTSNSGSGLEVSSAGISLLQGCSDGQLLKWNEINDYWYCANDAGGGGVAANSIDFSELKDALTLDGSTSVSFGASNYGLTFTNNGTGNAAFNLTSTGDFVVQNNGIDALTVNDNGEVVLGSAGSASGKLVFSNSSNSNTVTIQAGATAANYSWTLPNADAAGCLASDGSGTLSIAACGDTQQQTFSSSGNYVVPENALMVIIEGWGGGGGGGGGTGGTTAAVRSGGAGGGGGSYATTIMNAATLGAAGTNVPVTVGTGGNGGNAGADGSAGARTCFSTSPACAGNLFIQAYGGGGGNGDGTAGNGGGGGGGNQSVGTTNGTAATGGTGGGPLGASAGAQNSGFGGAGGATAAATGAAGGSGSYGGGGGGSSSSTGAGNSGAGGGGVQGGAGGGAGGTCAITTCTVRQGGAGGKVPGTSGGGGTAGTTAGQSGGAGSGGVGSGGDGGGGGANTNVNGSAGGNGGAGGDRGGGGGGGGASSGTGTQTGGTGGKGGDGYLRVWTLRGAGADLAEIYCSNEKLEPGTVVSLDTSIQNGVKKSGSAYDASSIGIVSTSPGLIIGESCPGNTEPAMVALAGRIPLKVSLENGPIKAGDMLTAAKEPGYAMKATKAGNIIGQALSSYSGDGPSYVVAFVKNGQGNGEKLGNILPGLSDDEQQKTFQQQALAYLSSGKGLAEDSADLSEITTDRLTAGLEVITPSVYANSVATNTIESASGDSVSVKVSDAGGVRFVNSQGQVIGSLDSAGNAQFSGTITADKLKVGSIEGLSSSDSPAADTQNANNQDESANGSTSQETQPSNLESVEAVNLVALARLESRGGLTVDKDAQFNGRTIFQLLAEFKGDANFYGNVSFDNQPSLNSDAGGTAVINPGKQKVEIRFTKPYPQTPIVTANWSINSDIPEEQAAQFEAEYDHYIAKASPNGFTILLNKPAQQVIRLNWSAISVKDAKMSLSDQ